MPYPNEHACRLRDPNDFQADSFRRITRDHDGKEYSCVMGKLTDETTMTEQAYRYAKDKWTASEAGSHCREHDGSFEAASESKAIEPHRLLERRVYPLVEIRVETREDGALLLEGHAAVFNQETVIGAMFRETIAPGAFAKTLQGRDIVMLWNHDDGKPLGRMSAGTLRLAEDDIGLAVSVDLPPNTWGRDAHISVGRQDVKGMSFAFETIRDDYVDIGGETPLRTLREVKLFEVSPVTFPAYEMTDVEARAILNASGVTFATTSTPGQDAHLDAGAEKRKRLLVFKARQLENKKRRVTHDLERTAR